MVLEAYMCRTCICVMYCTTQMEGEASGGESRVFVVWLWNVYGKVVRESEHSTSTGGSGSIVIKRR